MHLRSRTAPFCAALFLTTLASREAGAQCTYTWPAAAFGAGCADATSALALLANGDTVVGGRFTTAGGVPASRIARWNGGVWSPLGLGVDGEVHALAVGPFTGMLFAGGTFANAGGAPASMIARWDGASWSPLGAGVAPLVPFGASVQAIAATANGDVFVGGAFASVGGVPAANIARWDGIAWNALGTGCNGPVRGVALAPNGDLYAIGGFTTAGGVLCNGIARWDGAAWSALGTGLGIFGATCVTVANNGDVLVGGSFLTAGGVPASRIARWSAGAWSALGSGLNGPPTSVLALPTGGILAGGLFSIAGGVPAASIALWDGAVWAPLAGGCNGPVLDMTLAADHTSVVAAGEFTLANGIAAGRVARVVSSCSGSVVGTGGGCSGAGGPNVLTPLRVPLIGGQYRAVGTGMPPFGAVASVAGFAPASLALDVLFPGQGVAGCVVHSTPDVIDALTPIGGSVQVIYGFGASPSLIGASFFHQFVPVELDQFFNVTAITASNGVLVTLGTF